MKIYKKIDNLLEREIEQEVIIVESITGMCHVLNGTGTIIWNILNEKSYDDIVDEVSKMFFDVNKNELNKDVSEFLNELMKKNLVHLLES